MGSHDESGFERAVREQYRRTVAGGDDARERLIERVRTAPPPRRNAAWRPWRGGESHLRAALVAAGALVLVGGALVSRAIDPSGEGSHLEAPPGSEQPVVRFQIEAPGAAGVTLVGDFNDWDPAATPMRRSASDGAWSVSLPVTRGRHVYGFVVDGHRWMSDPTAPRAPEDGFGTPGSVIVVTRSES
jgi:hypothetical protein